MWSLRVKLTPRNQQILPIASNSQKQKFNFDFAHNIYHDIFDEHLWLSIFSRPHSSHFARVQRCTCCFVFLYIDMLLDILYYDQLEVGKNNKKLDGPSIGSFYFGRKQIGIGIICDLLLFIPNLFLVMFFRWIRRRQSLFQISPILKVVSQLRSTEISTTNHYIERKNKKRAKSFPWWCLFIAYGLTFLLIIISILMVIARGIEIGDIKVQKWLGSLIIAFLSSVLLTQPIKVLGLTLIFVLICRRINNNEEAVDHIDKNEHFYLNGDEEDIEPIQTNSLIDELQEFPSVQRSLSMNHLRNLLFAKLEQLSDAINMIALKSPSTQETEQKSIPIPILTTDCMVQHLDEENTI